MQTLYMDYKSLGIVERALLLYILHTLTVLRGSYAIDLISSKFLLALNMSWLEKAIFTIKVGKNSPGPNVH